MCRVSRVGMTDGRKPNRARRRGSLPVLLTARTSRGLLKCSPDTRTLVGGRTGGIIACEFRPITKCGCTGAFIFFSSSRNVLFHRLPKSRTGAKPVDLEENSKPERLDLKSIGSVRRECSDKKRSIERSRGTLDHRHHHHHRIRATVMSRGHVGIKP